MCLSLTEVGKEGDLVFGAGEAVFGGGGGGPRFWYPAHGCLPKASPQWWVRVLAVDELTATVVLAFPSKCHFGELQWSTALNYNLDFLFFNKHLFPEKANPILFSFNII